MAYNSITTVQALIDLSEQLYDPNFQRWSRTELTNYLTEALQTWNALACTQRAEFTFPTVANQTWYDLTTQIGSLRAFTMTDAAILAQIQSHLLEPVNVTYPLVWAGSGQFTFPDLISAIQRRRDQVVGTSGCQVSVLSVPALPGRTFLPGNVIDVRRVAWIPTPGLGYLPITLRTSDIESQEDFDFNWTTSAASVPSTYLQNAEPTVSFDVDRDPPVVGMYECLVVQAPAILDLSAPSILGVPDDWAWLVKWGALADILSAEGNAKDAPRADYCEGRFQQGLELMQICPAVLGARLANIPLGLDALRDVDDFLPAWQSTAGSPQIGAVAGLNLLGLGLPSGVQSVTVNVVQNMPIGTFLQISQDDYAALLDYAQHLAMFKIGGQEFTLTAPAWTALTKRATLYNARLAEMGDWSLQMAETSQLEESRQPRYSKIARNEQ